MEPMKPSPDKKFRPANLLNALPDAVLAGTFMYAWLRPAAIGLEQTRGLILLLLIEFVNIHSSVFMGKALLSKATRSARLKSALFFGVFYSIFVAGFAVSFKVWWPIPAFWLLTANRLMVLLPGQAPKGHEIETIERSWVAGIVLYIAAAILSILPWPGLGFTPDIVKALHLPASGAWIDTPQRAMAAGVLYFGLTALSEIFGHRWMGERKEVAVAAKQPSKPSPQFLGIFSLMMKIMGCVFLIGGVATGVLGVWALTNPDVKISVNGVPTSAASVKWIFMSVSLLFIVVGSYLVRRGGKIFQGIASLFGANHE